MKLNGRMVFVILLVVLASSMCAETCAWGDAINDMVSPGKRRGLALRFDFAGGLTRTTAEHSSWTPTKWSSDNGGAGLVLGLGVGITDQLMVNGSLRGLIYGEYAILGIVTGPFVLLFSDEHIATCLGLSYYLRKKSPSWFVEAGVGSGSMGNPFDEKIVQQDNADGPTFYGGIGYEFKKHFQVELHLLRTQNSEDDYNRRGKWTASSVFLTIGVMAY